MFKVLLLSVVLAVGAQATEFTDPMIVQAEGRGTSDVGEHVARRLAKSRAFASARAQCRDYGFGGEPLVLPGTGFDTANGQGNHWRAHYFADFECTNNPAPGEQQTYGPWTNLDKSLKFQVLKSRLSWWQAAEECQKISMRLPVWKELSANWQYLLGTTQANHTISILTGCASTCPVSVWTSTEKNEELAYDFSNLKPKEQDPRGAPKHWKFPVLCVAEVAY